MTRVNNRQKLAMIMVLLQIPTQVINIGFTGYSVSNESQSQKGPVSQGASYTGVILAALTLITLTLDFSDRYLLARAREAENPKHCHLRQIVIQASLIIWT